MLALVATEMKSDSALAKAVAKAGQVLAYEVPKKKLPEWVAEQFARFGAKAEPDACRALVEMVGDDLDELASEVDKLATWAEPSTPITLRDVQQLAAGRAETAIFAVTDAWGRRDVGATLRSTEELMERSHRPRSGELMRIIGSMVGHVGRVRRCQKLAEEGVRPRDAAASLKMHPFVAEKAFAQAANYSAEELADAIVRLAELDAASKGGSRLPARSRARANARRDHAPRELGVALRPRQSRAACALRRAAVLRCRAPRAAALSSQRTSARWRSSTRRRRPRRRPHEGCASSSSRSTASAGSRPAAAPTGGRAFPVV